MKPIITIPKPCHEDWNTMTPDERGAFCKVCSKSVWDFTNRTPEEIQHILVQERGNKMCGRFRSDQLAQPVDVHVPLHVLLQQHLPRLTRFALTAFVVFGASLFSFISAQGQVLGKVRIDAPHQLQGEVEWQPQQVDTPHSVPMIMGGSQPVDALPAIVDSTVEEDYITGDTTYYEELLGEVYNEPQDTGVHDTAAITPEPMRPADEQSQEVMPADFSNIHNINMHDITYGSCCVLPVFTYYWALPTAVAWTNITVPVINVNKPEQFSAEELSDEPLPNEKHIGATAFHPIKQGKFVPEPEYVDIPDEAPADTAVTIDADNTAEPLTEPAPPQTDTHTPEPDATISVWPNPAVNIININYHIAHTARVDISIFDMQGQQLQRLAAAEQHDAGMHTRTFDVSTLATGTYLVVIKSGEVLQTIRFVRS